MSRRPARASRHSPRIPEAELDVLSSLREAGEATAADLARALEPSRPLAHGSVATLLLRLEARGLVTRRKGSVGKAFVYRATPRAEAALRALIERLVTRVFGGNRMRFVASFFESSPPSAREVARLETLLRGLKAGARRPGRGGAA